MSDDEVNIGIAEACGWTVELSHLQSGIDVVRGKERRTLPNYCGDLNAMHEAEKMLSASDRNFYSRYIHWLHIAAAGNGWGNYAAAHATARQRVEAFLRTLGRWKR